MIFQGLIRGIREEKTSENGKIKIPDAKNRSNECVRASENEEINNSDAKTWPKECIRASESG